MTERTEIVETTERRSRQMSRVGQKNTPPELAVRRIINELGHRFRTQARDLPGSPDIVNRSKRWAIFVHGCYWHAHKGCVKSQIPKRNQKFWKKKFSDNRKRDQKNEQQLVLLGFRVLTIWECELKHPDFAKRKLKVFFDEMGQDAFVVNGQRFPQLRYSYAASKKEVCLAISVSPKRTLRKRKLIERSSITENPTNDLDRAFLRQRSKPAKRLSGSPIRCADLFSGCGGLTLGIQTACDHLGLTFESAIAIDSHADSIRVYEDNFNVAKTYTEDIRRLLPKKFGDAVSDKEANLVGPLPHIDMLVAGPPCQGHSDLNNHTRRVDLRNGLYLRVARFVELVRPTFVLIENVPTIVHARQRLISKTTSLLQDLGYSVDSASVDLLSLGVPQTRRRHVLVGSLKGMVDIREVVDRFAVPDQRTVMWAIDDLVGAGAEGIFDSQSKHSERNLERIEYLFENNLYELPAHLRPKCHQKKHSYKSMYGRLRANQPAQTITTGFGSPGQGRFIHPLERRTLTPHEAARIQCFPDFFDFSSAKTRTSLSTMIGNAVPMQLSYVFAMELLTRIRLNG